VQELLERGRVEDVVLGRNRVVDEELVDRLSSGGLGGGRSGSGLHEEALGKGEERASEEETRSAYVPLRERWVHGIHG